MLSQNIEQKRYFIVDQQIAQHFMKYRESL